MPLMRLGDFIFTADSTNFQRVNEKESYDWTTQEKLVADNSLRWAGKKSSTKILNGILYSDFSNILSLNDLFGNQSVEELVRMGDSGQSFSLFDGIGRNLGKWVIKDINVGKEFYNQFGVPLKQEFTLELEKDLEDSRSTRNTLLDLGVLTVSRDNLFVQDGTRALRGISNTLDRVEGDLLGG